MLTNLRIWKLSEHITHLPKLSSASNMQTKSITVFISQPTDSRKRAKKNTLPIYVDTSWANKVYTEGLQILKCKTANHPRTMRVICTMCAQIMGTLQILAHFLTSSKLC